MRRVVTLLNQVAATLENSAGLQGQMDGAVKAAKQHQEDNLRLKQVRSRDLIITEPKVYLSFFLLFTPQHVLHTATYCTVYQYHDVLGLGYF